MYKTIIIPPIGLVNLKRIQLLEPYEPECLSAHWLGRLLIIWSVGLSRQFILPCSYRSSCIEPITMNKIDNIITSKKLLWNYKTCSFRFAEFKKNKTLFYFFHLLKPNAIAVKMMAIIVDIMRLSTSSAPYSK